MRHDRAWYHIKAALEAKGTSLSILSRQLDVTRAAMTKVKRVPIPGIQSAIAAALGEKPQDIWPSRYDRFGKPVRRLTWLRKHSPDRDRGHGQKKEAA